MLGYYLQLAWRSLRRNRLLTVLMVVSIAVGIGASMTTLTVMRLLAGDPLPGKSGTIFYPQVDPNPEQRSREPYDMLDYRSAMDLWSARRADRQALVVDSSVKIRRSAAGRPTMGVLLSTTADFFPMFNVPFAYGSGWSAEDDARRARVAVISAALNERLFGGRDSVGHMIRLNQTDVRIVGVLKPWRPSPQFYTVAGGRFANGNTAGFYAAPEDVMSPFSSALEFNDGNFGQFTCWSMPETPGSLVNSPCVWVQLWVQLSSAQKVADYRGFLRSYAAEQARAGRIRHPENTRMPSLMEWLDMNGVVPSDVKLQVWLAFAFLFICLVNAVGLLLAKFLRRSGDIGVRRALGATQRDIFAQCLTEAGVTGLAGGALGWLLTLFGLWLVRQQPVEYADLARLDLPMFALTLAMAVVASVLAGVVPALRASRIVPAMQLKTL